MDLYMFILFPENIWDGFKEFYVKKPPPPPQKKDLEIKLQF